MRRARSARLDRLSRDPDALGRRALAALAADGTLARLEKRWLTTDLSRLRVLR